MPRTPPFSEADARVAIEGATCWAEALRALGYTPKGSNYRTLQRYAEAWQIPTDHFDPNQARRRFSRERVIPLERVLVEHSSYPRGKIKARLYASGLKAPKCELCGQGETWHGMRMSLVLDHINGVSNDNRLGNLRIVCPNCAATLATHCGRNLPRERVCPGCHEVFVPHHIRHRYCSSRCWGRVQSATLSGVPQPSRRKVVRPSYGQLRDELSEMSFLAVGRKYGVSDNAVRKWLRAYERERPAEPARADDMDARAA
jgi:hypothetical protein